MYHRRIRCRRNRPAQSVREAQLKKLQRRCRWLRYVRMFALFFVPCSTTPKAPSKTCHGAAAPEPCGASLFDPRHSPRAANESVRSGSTRERPLFAVVPSMGLGRLDVEIQRFVKGRIRPVVERGSGRLHVFCISVSVRKPTPQPETCHARSTFVVGYFSRPAHLPIMKELHAECRPYTSTMCCRSYARPRA